MSNAAIDNTIKEKFLSLGYEVSEQLGEGGGGSVFKAYHKNLQKEVVIKKIHDRFKDSETQRQEVDILKNLRHSYIPQVYDYFEIDGIGYTVMDYVPGDSIGNYLKKGKKFSDKQIVKYSLQLCEAVAYLHDRKIPVIHGDIKPDNIMLRPDGDICLIDFNISGISADGNAETNGYTPGYGAPEQYIQLQKIKEEIKKQAQDNGISEKPVSDDATEVCDIDEYATEVLGDDATLVFDDDKTEVTSTGAKDNSKSVSKNSIPKIKIDKRSDVYSIGATMYRLYTGKLVTEGATSVNSGKSDAFINIINKAISANPQKRYESAGEMLKALQSIHKQDKKYKKMIFVQNLIRFILVIMLFTGIALIYLGKQTKVKETYDQYNLCLEEMSDAMDDGDIDVFDKAYEGAVNIFPERIEPYYYRCTLLYDLEEYEADINYIEKDVLTVSEIYYQDGMDIIYACLAGCYYELDDYKQSANNYATAIYYNDNDSGYYVDYAFSLAKNGDTDKARTAINTAKEKGASGGYVYLAEGEILLGEGKYDDALEVFDKSIENADSDYTKMRAYLGMADAYKGKIEKAGDEEISGLYEEYTGVLLSGEKKLADEYVDAIREEVAIAAINASKYVEDAGYEEMAISELSSIIKSGIATFDTYYSLENLYLTIEDYESAGDLVDSMENLFPDNYRVYKAGAIIQVQLINEGLVVDYSVFEYYYDKATELYQDEEMQNDQQMEQLDTVYSELQSRGVL